jgi:hypothetical protein
MRDLIRFCRVIIISILLLLFSSNTILCGSICYSDKYYPAVVKLEATKNGFIAFLGGKFRIVQKKDTSPYPTYTSTYPAVIYEEGVGWKLSDKTLTCKHDWDCIENDDPPNEDAKKIPPIQVSKEEVIKYIPEAAKWDDWGIGQSITATFVDGNAIWFGIGFYDGEGSTGVGGFGKFNIKTGKIEIIRPQLTIHSSISPMLFDGKSLWFGTYNSYECLGYPPANGLVRYEWKTGEIESFEGKDNGPCGFLIRDLLKQGHYLWVATDLGLSRWDYKKKKWDHFVPTLDAETPFKCTTCESVYADLLNTLPKVYDPKECDNFASYYEQLTQELEKFRPKYLRSYLLSKPPKEWSGSDLAFLAKDSKDFNQLNKEVLSQRETDDMDYHIIGGFRAKKCLDPGWRDYLIKVVYADKGYDSASRAWSSLNEFKNDEIIGNCAKSFLEKLQPGKGGYSNCASVLFAITNNLGKKSVPFLIDLLCKFREDKNKFYFISVALDRETNNNLTRRDLKEVGEYKGTPASFSPEDICADWMKWWDVHKAEYTDSVK